MPTTRLVLRRVRHAQAHDNYRVICDGTEVGSIGLQMTPGAVQAWRWGIDTVLPRQPFATSGAGVDRDDCMRQFRRAWNIFVADPDRLAAFTEAKAIAGRAPWRK